MVSGRDSRGHFIKGNVPWNKGNKREIPRVIPGVIPGVITFTCKHCGKKKPLDEMRTAMRFFPPLIVCQGCWKLLEAPLFIRVEMEGQKRAGGIRTPDP